MEQIDNVLDLVYEFNERMRELVEQMDFAKGEVVGLDPRAGGVYIDRNCIISESPRSIDYYGGFEYVDADHIIETPDFKIYLADSNRVQSHIETYYRNKKI